MQNNDINEIKEIVTRMDSKLDSHTKILDSHTEKLNSHSKILNYHTKKFDDLESQISDVRKDTQITKHSTKKIWEKISDHREVIGELKESHTELSHTFQESHLKTA